MRKLLRAYFVRLRRDRTLWLFMLVMLALAAVVMFNGVRANQSYPDEASFASLDSFFFESLPYLGLFAGAAIALFLGVEYADGTLRNKLVAGVSRGAVYLSSLIASVAAAELVALAWFLGGLTGVPHFGFWTMGARQLLPAMLIVALGAAALAALFHLVGMLVTNRAYSVVAAVFLALGLLMVCSLLYNQLCEPETTISGITVTSDGVVEMGGEIANPAYVGGALRTVYTVLLHLLPPGQAILLANFDDPTVPLQPALAVTGSFGILLLAAAAGLAAFRKKDLK